MRQGKLLVMIGTRPEAIKMLPLIEALQNCQNFNVCVASSGQHRDLLAQTLPESSQFLDMKFVSSRDHKSIIDFSARCLEVIPPLLDHVHPDLILVQGDTTTAVMSGVSAFYKKIPVGHVEAGLRTGNRYSPFPEEIHRRLLSVLSDLHFCPTENARNNLLEEGVPKDQIFVTGNTSIDILKRRWAQNIQYESIERLLKRTTNILVTLHRRENFGLKMKRIFEGIKFLADAFTDIQFIFPVHPNPEVKNLAWSLFNKHRRIQLLEPLSHREIVSLMRHTSCVITDSGGLQEEAPTLGIPTLIVRDNTERPEALETGYGYLVGTEPQALINQFTDLKRNGVFEKKAHWAGGPFGDGTAATKILEVLKGWWLFKNSPIESSYSMPVISAPFPKSA